MKHDINEFLDLFYPKLYPYQRAYIIDLFDDKGNFKHKKMIVMPRGNSGLFMRRLKEDYRKFLEKMKESE